MTFLLSRGNLGISEGGIFTIGEVNSNWAEVTNQPHLPIVEVIGRWLTVADAFIVNGESLSGHGLLYVVIPHRRPMY